MRKIIGLAALARSGKDTVASLLLQHKKVTAYALADPVKIGCQVLFGLTDEEAWSDRVKEKEIPLWRRSPREFFQLTGTDWMRTHNPEHWLMRAERAIDPPTIPANHTTEPQLLDANAPFKLAARAFFDLSDNQTWDKTYYDKVDSFWCMAPNQMFELINSLTLKDFPDYYNQRAQRPIALPTREIPFIDKNEVIIIKDIRFENEAAFIRNHEGQIWHIVRNNVEKVNAHRSELGISVSNSDIVIDNNGTLEQLAAAVDKQWQNCFGK